MNDSLIGKDVRCWGVRGSQIGDIIMSLPILNWLERRFPDCYKHWQIARKHVHAAPLFYNHPLIDKLVISDGDEGMGPNDHAIASTCQIRFNVMPQHPEPHVVWPNVRTIWEETWVMAGLPLSEYHALPVEQQRAKLVQWFKVEKQPKKTIAYWPCAQYGQVQAWHPRSASHKWAFELATRLQFQGYKVIQYGHPDDFKDCPHNGAVCAVDAREVSFMDQVKESLGCDLVIGTDSGAGLVIGAYESVPQISLLTNHYPGHNVNLKAFETNSPLNRSFVGVGSADNISIDEVISSVKEMIN